MERLPLVIIRRDMVDVPNFDLLDGYRFRLFRSGDEVLWAEIEHAAGEFDTVSDALTHFEQEFGPYLTDMQDRCFFIETDDGRVIGTGTAWYDRDFMGQDFGRLHWIGIRPEFHGLGLGKALVSRLMERLSESHERAYLTTQTTSVAAVKIYLDIGFVPLPGSSDFLKAWSLIYEATRHPLLLPVIEGSDCISPSKSPPECR